MVEAPQEFDEKGKELGPDAQVWKTYVREADQVDEELVDGWNKSMDVMLIVFAALFSAISTAFVIESYRNLKQDPTDISSRTLFTISQTLMFIANGSEPSNVPLTFETEVSPFHPSAKAICVNVLWFSSLSLSVAVSLISMLAKEWCLEYMTGRTGPAGAQARRRQQRWDGLVKWRMRELIMMLPSLIHLSLLLFAIGLCIFLWDVHYGVAIPVIIITLIAAGAYLACTIVPFLYDYCPYATVLSRLFKQLITIGSQLGRDNVIQDEITANALNWMIVNCETPRSVDIALQSLAAADENLPTRVLEQRHAWVTVKQRLECGEVDKQFERNQKALEYLWATLMAITYSDSSALKRLDVTYLAYGMWYLRTNPNLYNLSRDDCATIKMALNWTQSANEPSNRIQSIYHAYYIHRLSHDITTMADRDSFAPLVLMAVDRLRRYSPWDGYYVLPTSEIYTLVIKYLCTTNDTTSLDCWNGYWILAYSPIPKLSPRLVQELSSSDSITHLSNAMHSEDHHTRVFAAAQLWVLFSMSIYEADRTNPALSALEAELLKYPRLENSLERQEAVAEELEAKLMALREVVYSHLEEYISRVMEVMLQRRSAPLPRSTDSVLKRIPRRLCGIESFVNYETERSIAYPDLVFDSEGRPSPAPSGQE
ncbi:unnamed protein product [Rhizoctonia solani]|uniref:DUF6535 domain-containing protein n=1 Tax=Rhizoctonia solani TaxID=456999 RepID=A0A8H2WZP9_9AGAM|nr:unnamed protein product [Rhizoctonia solani]